MTIPLTSSVFAEGEFIPAKYTCDGEDVSPPLKWSNVPTGAKGLALICDDPDAPVGTWVHWVLYGLPPTEAELPEKIPSTETLANGAKQGINDFKRIGYGGRPPVVRTVIFSNSTRSTPKSPSNRARRKRIWFV